MIKSFKEFLNESPYVTDENPDVLGTTFPSTSKDALDREYEFLFRIKGMLVYKNKKSPPNRVHLRGVAERAVNGRHQVIFNLSGTTMIEDYMLRVSGIKNPLQIQQVHTYTDYAIQGLGRHVYLALVDHGYTIVSDKVQLEGGMYLWQSIIRNRPSGYVVGVWNGKTRRYSHIDDFNVTYDKIWTSGDDTSGRKMLLILAKK